MRDSRLGLIIRLIKLVLLYAGGCYVSACKAGQQDGAVVLAFAFTNSLIQKPVCHSLLIPTSKSKGRVYLIKYELE